MCARSQRNPTALSNPSPAPRLTTRTSTASGEQPIDGLPPPLRQPRQRPARGEVAEAGADRGGRDGVGPEGRADERPQRQAEHRPEHPKPQEIFHAQPILETRSPRPSSCPGRATCSSCATRSPARCRRVRATGTASCSTPRCTPTTDPQPPPPTYRRTPTACRARLEAPSPSPRSSPARRATAASSPGWSSSCSVWSPPPRCSVCGTCGRWCRASSAWSRHRGRP